VGWPISRVHGSFFSGSAARSSARRRRGGHRAGKGDAATEQGAAMNEAVAGDVFS